MRVALGTSLRPISGVARDNSSLQELTLRPAVLTLYKWDRRIIRKWCEAWRKIEGHNKMLLRSVSVNWPFSGPTTNVTSTNLTQFL